MTIPNSSSKRECKRVPMSEISIQTSGLVLEQIDKGDLLLRLASTSHYSRPGGFVGRFLAYAIYFDSIYLGVNAVLVFAISGFRDGEAFLNSGQLVQKFGRGFRDDCVHVDISSLG